MAKMMEIQLIVVLFKLFMELVTWLYHLNSCPILSSTIRKNTIGTSFGKCIAMIFLFWEVEDVIILSVREEDDINWKAIAELRAVKAENDKKKSKVNHLSEKYSSSDLSTKTKTRSHQNVQKFKGGT